MVIRSQTLKTTQSCQNICIVPPHTGYSMTVKYDVSGGQTITIPRLEFPSHERMIHQPMMEIPPLIATNNRLIGCIKEQQKRILSSVANKVPYNLQKTEVSKKKNQKHVFLLLLLIIIIIIIIIINAMMNNKT